MRWLSPLPTAQIHQTISDQAEEGSGKWFLNSDAFQRWHNGEQRQLWCWGIPGAGKTVLASIIINHLRQQRPEQGKNSVGLTFMYLKYNEPDQTIDNIFATFLKQLVQECDTLPIPLVELYEHHHDRNTSPILSEILETLSAILEEYTEVYCVLDALDECSEELRWELLENLRDLQPKFRLLATSSYLDIIAEVFQPYERFEIRANKADIELFIENEIKRNKNLLKLVHKSSTLRDEIKRGIVETAEDTFLLARLHVESLASVSDLSVKHVRNKLQNLPTTLTEAYDEVMQRIVDQAPDYGRLALTALGWVSSAFRPLSLRELQHALALEPGDKIVDEDSIIDGQSIIQFCAGLVIVDQRTSVINLVHYSTKRFLDDIRHVQFPNIHASITLLCASYLTLDTLKSVRIWEMVQKYPLACYAAEYMGDHARNSPDAILHPSTVNVVCRLLSHPERRKPLLSLLDALHLTCSGFNSTGDAVPHINPEILAPESGESEMPALFEAALELSEHCTSSSTLAASTIRMTDNKTNTSLRHEQPWESKIKSSRIPELTALHLAASMGVAKIASLLLKETANIDPIDETGKTALVLAMERGFEKAIELLIDSGARVDLRHGHGQAILLLVNERDWRVAADLIVAKARAELDEAFGIERQQLSLLLAVHNGDVEELRHIIRGQNLDLKSASRKVGEVSLFLAVERQNVAMVQNLITLAVDVNAKDNSGQTALHRATRRNNESLIKLLLLNRAMVDCKDDDGRTPWSANICSSYIRFLDVLRDAGADPNTKGLQGVSELYTAAKDGETDIVRFMLESGTSPSIQTNYQWAPLHWASFYGHIECVRLLVEAGADVSVVSDQRVTPLDLAVQAGQNTIIDILSAAGAKEYKDIRLDPSKVTSHAPPETKGIASDRAKLQLVYDKPLARTLNYNAAVGQYIYMAGTTGPSENIYAVSHVLESQTSSISVRHSPTRADMCDYPLPPEKFDDQDIMYDIVRIKPDYQEFELRGRHQDHLPGTIRMHRVQWNGIWQIRHDCAGGKRSIFRTMSDWSGRKDGDDRWVAETGILMARSGWDDATPNLCFEVGAEPRLQDVIVACWIAKLWSETVAPQCRE